MNQSELEANTLAGAKRGETCASKSRLVMVLLPVGPESGARYFSQSLRVAMQNQSSSE